MKRNGSLKPICIIIFTVSCLVVLVAALTSCIPTPIAREFTSPLPLQEGDLAGVWETSYRGDSSDILCIREDGTFLQTYTSPEQGYTFDSKWNQWRLEYLPSEGVRMHLSGARYFLDGIAWAERNSDSPYDFYDPFEKYYFYADSELVLAVLRTPEGELVLHHMWTSSDRGFAIFGGEVEIFYQTNPVVP